METCQAQARAASRPAPAGWTGDGSLGFYLSELDSLVRHQLPVVAIIGNDGAWGLERELQAATEGSTVACDPRRSRYDSIMGQLRPATERAFAYGGPYAINITIEAVRPPFTRWQIESKAGAS